MIDECPMTEECPAYDRDRATCLVRPGDCDFLPADGGADPHDDGREAPRSGASDRAAVRTRST